jgi:hypothetical protein
MRAAEDDDVQAQEIADEAVVKKMLDMYEAVVEARLDESQKIKGKTPSSAGDSPIGHRNPYRQIQQKRRLNRRGQHQITVQQGVQGGEIDISVAKNLAYKAWPGQNPTAWKQQQPLGGQGLDPQSNVEDVQWQHGTGSLPNERQSHFAPGGIAQARGTGTIAKVKRLNPGQKNAGTRTQPGTRPPGWAEFISVFGSRVRGVPNTYGFVMGHLLNEKMGGRGELMDNLSPFSTKLNHDHSQYVEEPLKQWLGVDKNGRPNPSHAVDYRVEPTYDLAASPTAPVGPTMPVLHPNHQPLLARVVGARDSFYGRFPRRAAAMLGVRFAQVGDATTISWVLRQGPPYARATVLPSGVTFGDVLDRSEAYLRWYISLRMPISVTCRARLYDTTGAGGKSPTFHADLQHLA